MTQRAKSNWAVLATAAIVGCMAGGHRAGAAPDAEAIFKKARRVAEGAKSLKATLRVNITQGQQTGGMIGPIELLKPNYGRISLRGSGAMARSGVQQFISNGKKVYIVATDSKQYLEMPAERKGENLFGLVGRKLTPIIAFTDPGFIRREGAVQSVTSVKVNNKPYQKVILKAETPPAKRVLFFGSGGMLEGIEYSDKQQGQSIAYKVWLENITLNPKLAPKRFAYSPPAGYTVRDTSGEAGMLAVGSKAPAFSLPGAFGGTYSLKDLGKGKKATLVNFWFLNCGPCRMELPHLAKKYPGWKKRGLGMVAINVDDSAKDVQKYVFEEKLNYPVALAAGSPREKMITSYKVPAFPTVYLLDRNGKVVWRRAGYDPEGLEAAIEQALSK